MLSALAKKIFTPPFKPVLFEMALQSNDLPLVSRMLRFHPEIANWQNDKGRSALNIAVAHRMKDISKLLIAAGADIEHIDPDCQMQPLNRALHSGAAEIAEALIDKGANVNAKDGYGQTPIYMAISECPVPILRKLVQKGADIDVVCSDFTPLMLAAMADNEASIRFLVSQHADISIRKTNGVTANQLARSPDMEKYLDKVKEEYDNGIVAKAKAKAAEDARRAAQQKIIDERNAIAATIDSMTEGAPSPIKIIKTLKLNRRIG